MFHYRKQPWFTALSVLLLAVYVQAQVAGCCKLGSWFQSAASAIVSVSTGAESPASDPTANPKVTAATPAKSGMTADHSCCPKQTDAAEQTAPWAPDAAATTASHDCATSDNGCCLQGSDLNASGLVSIPGGPVFNSALPPAIRVLGLFPTADAISRCDFARMDSGPPEARANRPLLI